MTTPLEVKKVENSDGMIFRLYRGKWLIAEVYDGEGVARRMAVSKALLEACVQARAALPDFTFADEGQKGVVRLLNCAISDTQRRLADTARQMTAPQ